MARNKLFDEVLSNGFTARDTAMSILNQLLQKRNYKMYISNNALVVAPANIPTYDQGVVISRYTGLMNRPNKSMDGVISIECLIDYRLAIGSMFKLESEDLNGFFTISKIKYSGDNLAGKFTASIEAL